MSEEPSKQPCLPNIWVKINEDNTMGIIADCKTFYQLKAHLSIKTDYLFKQNGLIKELDEGVPDTTKDTPVLLITEVGKFKNPIYVCNADYVILTEIIVLHEDECKVIYEKPNKRVGTFLYNNKIGINKHVALLEGNVVNFDSMNHTLFGKTTFENP